MDDFILIDKVDEGICKNLIHIFESHPDKHFAGQVSYFEGNSDSKQIDTTQKVSVELELNQFNLPVLDAYYSGLQKLLMGYMQLYPEVQRLPKFTPTHARIQRYDKDGHFNSWHYERGGGSTQRRCLVYMTYLNDVDEGGQTYFKYQDKAIKPEIGKTVIWPADWTHTHKGIGPKEGYKYISTGWYVHDDDVIN